MSASDKGNTKSKKEGSDQPIHYQGITLLFALIIIVAGFGIFYLQAKVPTDNNLFVNIPSKLYISEELPAVSTESEDDTELSVLSGSFLISAQGIRLETQDQYETLLSSMDSSEVVELQVVPPDEVNRTRSVWVQRADLSEDQIFELKSGALVTSVQRDGVSERAGMKIGDLIIQIDNRSFEDIFEADAIMRAVEPGETVTYDVLRGGEIVRLYVTIATFGIPIYHIIGLLCGLIALGIGIYICLKSPEIQAARLIGWMLMALSYIIMANAVLRLNQEWVITANLALLSFSQVIFFILFTRLWFYFPKYRSDIQHHQKWFVPLVTLIGVILVLVRFLGSYQAYNMLGFIVNAATFILPIAWFIPTSSDSEYKSISRKLILVILGVLVSSLLLTIWLNPFNREYFLVYYRVTLLVIPISFLYFIGRYSLLNIDIHVRKSIQYWSLSVLWILTLCIGFLYLLYYASILDISLPEIRIASGTLEISGQTASSAGSEFLQRAMLMGSAIFAFLLFVRIGKYGQAYFNRVYHRSNYDYRLANRKINDIVSSNLTVESLNEKMTALVAELMLVRRVAIIIQSENARAYRHAFYQDGEYGEWDAPPSRFDALFQAMKDTVNEVRIDALTKTTRLFLVKDGFSIAVPLWSRKRLYGVLLLGEKLSEEAINQEDMTFLNLISHQSNIAFENAFLYEQLASQERLKQEMVIARRIQLASLPQTVPDIEGLEIAGASEPAYEVGGDYYDYLVTGKQILTVIVGDVSGKGTSAALYLSKVQGIIRTLSEYEDDPSELFTKTNALLLRQIDKQSFVTALGASFDVEHRSVKVARAGHLPIYRYDAKTDKVLAHTPLGTGMGMISADRFKRMIQQEEIPMNKGDVYLMISDGVTELKNEHNEEFGEEAVLKLFHEHIHRSARQIRNEIQSELRTFNNKTVPNDDQTIVVLKVLT